MWAKGIEPSSIDFQSSDLPLNYAYKKYLLPHEDSNPHLHG